MVSVPALQAMLEKVRDFKKWLTLNEQLFEELGFNDVKSVASKLSDAERIISKRLKGVG